jgi:hypothetical protein
MENLENLTSNIDQNDHDIRIKLASEEGDTLYELLSLKVSNIITAMCFDSYIYEKNNKIRITEINLLKYPQLMNEIFTKLIDYCCTKNIYDWAMVFIIFCDYFNLDYHKCYTTIALKAQKNIRKWASEYIDLKNKNTKVNTIFDL